MVWTCTGGIADMFAKVAEDGAARQGGKRKTTKEIQGRRM